MQAWADIGNAGQMLIWVSMYCNIWTNISGNIRFVIFGDDIGSAFSCQQYKENGDRYCQHPHDTYI